MDMPDPLGEDIEFRGKSGTGGWGLILSFHKKGVAIA
jgi:hypothetical protein